MRVVIEGSDLPGPSFVSDGDLLRNVHVAVQVGAAPVGLVRGDAASARWEALEVRAVVTGEEVDVRGPAVHGRKGERFLYLTWGDLGEDGTFHMFRRAKLMVRDIGDDLLRDAARAEGATLIASLGLTDERGGPRCARVTPPAIRWRRA